MWAVWVEIPWPGRCPPPQTTPLLLKFCALPTKQLCYSNFIESHTHNPSCLFSAFYSVFIPFHSPGSSSPLAQCFANSFQRITYQIKHYFLPVLPLSLLQPSLSSSLKNRRFFSVLSPKPIIIFFQKSSPRCLLIAYLTISSSALTLNLRFLSSPPPALSPRNSKYIWKPSWLHSLPASFSWSSSPHRISHTLFTSPQFGSAAGMSRPQLFMPNNTVSLFSCAPQSVYPSVLPCFILQF